MVSGGGLGGGHTIKHLQGATSGGQVKSCVDFQVYLTSAHIHSFFRDAPLGHNRHLH